MTESRIFYERKKIIILAALIALAGGLVFLYTAQKKPRAVPANFEECVIAGNPVLESYPRQCRAPNGKTFIEDMGNEPEKTDLIKIYYYNQELDKDDSGNILCGRKGLVAVKRKIPITRTPIQDAVKILLLGRLTDEERERGISTEYPLAGFSLKSASLKDGVLTLEFSDPDNKAVGGSCRVGILWFQIEATAKQFPEVKEVRFLPEEIFQP